MKLNRRRTFFKKRKPIFSSAVRTRRQVTIPRRFIKLVLFVIFSAAFFYLIFIYGLFNIKKVDVVNTSKIESTERKALAVLGLRDQKSVNFDATNSAELSTPSASFKKYFLIDQQGEIYSEVATNSALPLLGVAEDMTIGQKISSSLVKNALAVINFLPKLNVSLDFIQIDNTTQQILLSVKDGPLVRFSGVKDLNLQLTSLQLILERTRIEGRKLAKIDLRFEKPIIQ